MVRRTRSKIDALPPELKDAVEQMILNPVQFTYQDISEFLKDKGHEISYVAVYRYARRMNANIQMIVAAQENFQRLTEEMEKYPELDFVEVIQRILARQLVDRLSSAPDEQWDDLELDKTIKDAVALSRAATYKKRMDVQMRDKQEAGLQEFKALIFDAMAKERPELYHQVSQFINEKKRQGLVDSGEEQTCIGT
ncbi:hypothetical protein Dtox_4225 [Desulfofarcimen acetoxidans DSM 771]|uniref:DUF3486 family protein n=1 Tax=Desulfofarcimen acetoxidans (strain ATCC 49208 / DSM 771 / KCTC 5769 / VKM B-1644 / 5575) TaxID=485916 RepID=C8VZE7_DESAS|nr:phage protein Gp27 family protein [Desulfofarcimen acetoxidans]ACV64892.1 hypothetical protein Dtox_4225 [Desulfofarcimen acetoxidans DSM 771]